jgi:hypothetical protein
LVTIFEAESDKPRHRTRQDPTGKPRWLFALGSVDHRTWLDSSSSSCAVTRLSELGVPRDLFQIGVVKVCGRIEKRVRP